VTLPSDWYGVVGILIINIGILLQSRRNGSTAKEAASEAKEVGAKVQDIKGTVNDVQGQVANGHHTNLRDDLTEALSMMRIVKSGVENLQDKDIRLIRDDISRISGDISVLRGELTDERVAREDLAAEVHRHLPG
jgi:hypothetical protein